LTDTSKQNTNNNQHYNTNNLNDTHKTKHHKIKAWFRELLCHVALNGELNT